MAFCLRCPLVSISALTAYLAVNIGAGAVHRHYGAAILPQLPAGCHTVLQFQAASPEEADGGEETCLVCSVLHLAQTLSSTLPVAGVTLPTGEAFSAAVAIQPYPLETATRARSPPTA